MRKLPAVLAVLGLSALALTGCASGSTSASCPTPASVGRAAGLVDVSGGEVGSTPTVEVAAPFHTDRLSFRTIATGHGTPITSKDQLVALSYTLVNGDDGKTMGSSGYDQQSQPSPLSSWMKDLPELDTALHCATPGSRVVVALPPHGISQEARGRLQLGDTTSTALVVDVDNVYLAAADGANQYNAGFGLPSVVRDDNGRPGVIVPDGAAPEELVVQTLKKGDGDKIDASAPFRAHLLDVKWSDKSVVQNTWAATDQTSTTTQPAPESLDLTSMPAELRKALEGATVGSQIMIVAPASKVGAESGEEPSAHIYVIDILGIDTRATN